MEKAENAGFHAGFQHFLLFLTMFPKAFYPRVVKSLDCVAKSFNPLPLNPDFQRPQGKKAFENIVGKGENAGNQHFLLFP